MSFLYYFTRSLQRYSWRFGEFLRRVAVICCWSNPSEPGEWRDPFKILKFVFYLLKYFIHSMVITPVFLVRHTGWGKSCTWRTPRITCFQWKPGFRNGNSWCPARPHREPSGGRPPSLSWGSHAVCMASGNWCTFTRIYGFSVTGRGRKWHEERNLFLFFRLKGIFSLTSKLNTASQVSNQLCVLKYIIFNSLKKVAFLVECCEFLA